MCRRCSWEAEECVACGGNVGYSPQQAGLVDTYVSVVDLLAHANYTFEVEAVNGVSDLSRTQRLFAAVSIATSQASKESDWLKRDQILGVWLDSRTRSYVLTSTLPCTL
jgi:hypothetical protein